MRFAFGVLAYCAYAGACRQADMLIKDFLSLEQGKLKGSDVLRSRQTHCFDHGRLFACVVKERVPGLYPVAASHPAASRWNSMKTVLGQYPGRRYLLAKKTCIEVGSCTVSIWKSVQ
jgi:hypothetical protein